MNNKYYGFKEINHLGKLTYSYIFNNRKCVEMCVSKEERSQIIELIVEEHEDQSRPTEKESKSYEHPDYWGWLEKDDHRYSMIQNSFIKLKVCFTYGLDLPEQRGDGKAYRLNVKER